VAGTRKRQISKQDGLAELGLNDYRILAEFRFLMARFLAFSENAAKAEGLSARQHQALLAIKGYPSGAQVTVGDLAERLCVRHHSAVGLVDRLVATGYLARQEDVNDRRRIILTLTRVGERTLAALSGAHRQELRRIVPLLKPVLMKIEQSEND
jgi:DNA-binding MarR family transcriptional regulator